jgi:hypothetical protein
VRARPIDVNDGESEVIGKKREGGRDGKLVNGMVGELKHTIVPSGKDTPRGTVGGFENDRTKGRREKGGGKEGGNVSKLGLLQAKDGGRIAIDSSLDIVPFFASTKPTDVPRLNKKLN